MDQEFTNLVKYIMQSELCVEIIYDAIRTAQDFPDSYSPKLALQLAVADWDK
jgi:hypothetical protein